MAINYWHTEEVLKSVFTFAVEGLKFISLINGGAAIAVVAYGLGKLPSISLWAPLAFFLFGVVLSAFAYIAAYLTQLALYEESANLSKKMWSHTKFLWCTGLIAISAVFAFVLGCIAAIAAISG